MSDVFFIRSMHAFPAHSGEKPSSFRPLTRTNQQDRSALHTPSSSLGKPSSRILPGNNTGIRQFGKKHQFVQLNVEHPGRKTGLLHLSDILLGEGAKDIHQGSNLSELFIFFPLLKCVLPDSLRSLFCLRFSCFLFCFVAFVSFCSFSDSVCLSVCLSVSLPLSSRSSSLSLY